MRGVRYPALYEWNTRILIHETSRALGRPATLDDVPDSALDHLSSIGFDWIWMLGAWTTGPAGRAVSRNRADWRSGYQRDLPDCDDDDVCGSPFAIRAYDPNPDFGGSEGLKRFRKRLLDRGVRLMLDFVPNHSALDHPWVWERPEFYVHGTEDDLARRPDDFGRVETSQGPCIFAHGRDPNFPGWPDTWQFNYRHAGLRAAMTEELSRIAVWCDGVRCDMAMLVQPDVFLRTWGDHSLPSDGSDPVDLPFWPHAIARAKRANPDFTLMAEVYWDLEWPLLQEGFDYTYDKRLYDRLRQGDALSIREHLQADLSYQGRMVRFLENHDEPRTAEAFEPARLRASAVAGYLTPGLRFFHDGQLEGRRRRASVHLNRRAVEEADPMLSAFYERLLGVLRWPEVRTGRWRLLDVRPAWEENTTSDQFLAYVWDFLGPPAWRVLVAVNFGPRQGQCYVHLPFPDLPGNTFLLSDLMGTARYELDGSDLFTRGLYLDMPAWRYHVFDMERSSAPVDSPAMSGAL
jgi:hypothetical protein